MRTRLMAALVLLPALAAPVALAQDGAVRRYKTHAQVIRDTANMVRDRHAQALVRRQGLSLINLTWEDTRRFKNSSVGPNISDMTIQIQEMAPRTERCRLTCMPVIRHPNFSDKTADISPGKFFLRVGNESGSSLRRVSLTEYLRDFRRYLSDPRSWKGKGTSLLAGRDTHVLVSAQACFLPVPRGGQATFNPVIFNYQSVKGDPAVLAILVTRQGTSATVIDNVRDRFAAGRTWGQRLFFNQRGRRASLTGRRLSDLKRPIGPGDGAGRVASRPGLNLVMLIQVPLKQKRRPRRVYELAEGATDAKTKSAPAGRGGSDVETAVIGHGRVEGPFTEIDNLAIERDPRYPVRVTVQFYKATSNGVIDARDVATVRAQIDRVYRDADYVGSLVTEGETGRPTEHDGPKVQPPGWWSEFWARYERNTGESRQAALKRLEKRIGRTRLQLIVNDKILLEKKLDAMNE